MEESGLVLACWFSFVGSVWRRYRRVLAAVASGGHGIGGDAAATGRNSNLNSLKLEAENQRLHEKLGEMARRYTEALEDKARAATSTLSTEEKRLEATKALLDVRIEAARVQEDAEAAKFEQVNRILELEREVRVNVALSAESVGCLLYWPRVQD
jgi:hypothetical protein